MKSTGSGAENNEVVSMGCLPFIEDAGKDQVATDRAAGTPLPASCGHRPAQTSDATARHDSTGRTRPMASKPGHPRERTGDPLLPHTEGDKHRNLPVDGNDSAQAENIVRDPVSHRVMLNGWHNRGLEGACG